MTLPSGDLPNGFLEEISREVLEERASRFRHACPTNKGNAEIAIDFEVSEATLESFRRMRESLSRLGSIELTTDPTPSQCQSCSYYSGEYRLPCAVHPKGPDEDGCGDWAER